MTRKYSVLRYDLSDNKCAVVGVAINQGISGDADTFSLIDRDGLQATVVELIAAFLSNFSHSFAIKENTYRWLLKVLCECGMMAEVASDAEMSMDRAAGFPADRTAYDAPNGGVLFYQSLSTQFLTLGTRLRVFKIALPNLPFDTVAAVRFGTVEGLAPARAAF